MFNNTDIKHIIMFGKELINSLGGGFFTDEYQIYNSSTIDISINYCSCQHNPSQVISIKIFSMDNRDSFQKQHFVLK